MLGKGEFVKTVLVVDDHEPFAKFLVKLTATLDSVEISVAHTVAQAKGLILDEDLAVVLLDHALPDGTGKEVIDYALSKGREVPYVIISNFDRSDLVNKSPDMRKFVDDAQFYILKTEMGLWMRTLLEILANFTETSQKVTEIHALAQRTRDSLDGFLTKSVS